MLYNNIGEIVDKFGHPILPSLLVLVILPLSTAYIDCRISCRRCHESSEHAPILEIYCAMCEECKQRRREKIMSRIANDDASHSPVSDTIIRENIPAYTEVSHSKAPRVLRTQAPNKFNAIMPLPHEDSNHINYNNFHLRQNTYYDEQDYAAAAPELQMGGPLMAGQMARPVAEMEVEQIAPEQMAAVQMVPAPIIMQAPNAIAMLPPNCPTPPSCSESEEEVTQHLRETSTRTTTTSTTTTTSRTTTTTRPSTKKLRRRIPHIIYQVVQPRPIMAPVMAPIMAPVIAPPIQCVPSCIESSNKNKHNQPIYGPQTHTMVPSGFTVKLVNKSTIPSAKSNSGFQYVYIGIPKKG